MIHTNMKTNIVKIDKDHEINNMILTNQDSININLITNLIHRIIEKINIKINNQIKNPITIVIKKILIIPINQKFKSK